jgi:hypothetical protein
MSYHTWALVMAGTGMVTLPAAAWADEKPSAISTGPASTTVSGYVDTSAQWNLGTGNVNTPPYAFSNGKADGFNLNVVKLTQGQLHPAGQCELQVLKRPPVQV